jgi:predicted aspartyl protease
MKFDGNRLWVVILAIPALAVQNPSTASEQQELGSQEKTQAAVQALMERRGPLPDRLAIMIKVSGRDYDDSLRSIFFVDSAGRFRREVTAGVSDSDPGSTTGFDGTSCWNREANGFVRELDWSDRDFPLFLAWFRTGQWLDRIDKASLRIEEEGTGDERTVFSVRHHGMSSKVVFSNKTGLAESFHFNSVQGDSRYEFSDYRQHYGLMTPTVVRVISPHATRETRVEAVELVEREVDFTVPSQAQPTIEYDATRSEKLSIERAPTGHVLVDVALGDGVQRKFIFDTGASVTVVDTSLAEKLKLDKLGEQSLESILGTQNASVFTTSSLTIGPARLNRPRLVGMDLNPFSSVIGDNRIEGIIGYDLLNQVICEIELESNTIQIFDDATFGKSHSTDLAWQKLRMLQNVPLVAGRFPQGDGLFRMDIGAADGAAGNVIFHSPAVRAMNVDTSAMEVVEAGNLQMALGPIPWFELGGHRFETPEVFYSLTKSGPLAEENIQGNIGVSFLKPFRLTLDYRNARMSLTPVKSP